MGLRSIVGAIGSALFKSERSEPFSEPSAPDRDARAYYSNPMSVIDATGYKNRNFSLSYEILKKMSTRNSVVASIILTRVNQVSLFTRPARFSSDGMGFEITPRDPSKIPSEQEKKAILALEMFIENCGFDADLKRDKFTTFIKKLIRDSLVYDQCCFEIVPDKKGRPSELLVVDAATIRAASEKNKSSSYSHFDYADPEEIDYVQVLDGVIQCGFTAKELAFCVRNPRSDINLQPYGFSELEQIIHQVTSHLFAEEYNSRFFSQGGTTKGILNIKTDNGVSADRESIESFKRQWKAQVSGLYGAWKTPILQVPGGLEYLNVSQSNREMEFEKWMNYLINVCCAVYQIDPAEVNFPNNGGVGGGGASLMEGGAEAKLQNSKDKGLRPLLVFVEDIINENIVSRFSEDLVFSIKGVSSKSEAEVAELDSSATNTYKTVNEVRAEHHLAPLDDGDTLLNGVYVQNRMNERQLQQQISMMTMQTLQQQQMIQPETEEQQQQEEAPVESEQEKQEESPETYQRQYKSTDNEGEELEEETSKSEEIVYWND